MDSRREATPRRVIVEFVALLTMGLAIYGLQTISERAGQILAIPLYFAVALFFWRRARTLGAVNASLTSNVLGSRAGRLSAATSASMFRFIGISALLLVPLALVCWLIGLAV